MEALKRDADAASVSLDVSNGAVPAETGDAGAKEPAFVLSPAEYLAAVPLFPKLRATFAGSPPPADRAKELRAARPLDRAALLAGLSAEPALQYFTAFQLWLNPFAARVFERGLAVFLTGMSVISSTWVFRTDYGFAARQFAVGFASWVLLFTQITLVHPSISTFRRALEPLGASHGDVPRTLDAYPLAGLARWRALLDDSSNGNPSKLLSHDPLDDLCPCSLSRCAGGLVKGIAILRIVEAAVKIALLGTFCVFTFWTPYITLASSFWGTTWTAVLGSLNAVALALYAFPNSICRFTASTTALRLSERVAHRAMKLALDDLLARLTTGASRPEASVAGEPYAELHTVFTAIWRTRISSFHFSRLQVLSAGLAALLSVVNMIVGSCIPSMFLGYILYAILAQVLFDLLALAASNAQVTSIRDLYLEAQREIRELPLPPDPQRAADLRRHDAVGWGSLYRWTLCARAGEDAVRGGMWYRCII